MEFTFICLVANSPASPSNGNVKQSLVLSRTCWQIIPHLIIMIIAWSECQSRERKCFRQDCWNNRLTTRPTVGEWFIPKTVNQITASLAEEEGPARNKVAFNAPTDWSLCWSTSCGEAPLFTLTKAGKGSEWAEKEAYNSFWLCVLLINSWANVL